MISCKVEGVISIINSSLRTKKINKIRSRRFYSKEKKVYLGHVALYFKHDEEALVLESKQANQIHLIAHVQ